MTKITKDAVVPITKDNPSLKRAIVGLGWDKNTGAGNAYDLDASALVLTGGKLAKPTDAVFFQNKKSTDGAVAHGGDNLTGDGAGDDETIAIDLTTVTGDQVNIVLTLYDAASRGQNLNQIPNAYIRLVDADSKTELLRYPVTGAEISGSSLLFASLRKVDGHWEFKAEGQPLQGEITEVLGSYGYAQAA